MAKDKVAVTPAIRMLRREKVIFSDHFYQYADKGGTSQSARELAVNEHCVIKTLIMEDDAKTPLIVLMHGDRQVSTRELARVLGVKSVSPCTPDTASRHSGYQVGGTSPFGTRRTMAVYMEATILDLPEIFINGGKRGFLIGLSPQEVARVLKPILVKIGIPG
jgi:Cys-tRNA(Pro) deacylase